MANRRLIPAQKKKSELRRDVTVWGSYTWGYADVGADIYAALGLVIAASQGPHDGFRPGRYQFTSLSGWGIPNFLQLIRVAGGGHYFRITRFRRFLGIRRRGRAFARLYYRYRSLCRCIRRLYQLFLPAVFGINVQPVCKLRWALCTALKYSG